MKFLLPIIILSTIIGAPLFAFGEGGLKALGAVFFVLWLASTVLALRLDRSGE